MPATAIVCVRISCHFFPSQKPWACVLLAWEKRCLRRNTAANPCFVNVFSKRYKIEKLVLSLWVRISWRKTWTQIETIICLSATPWHLLRLTLYRMRWANIEEQKPPMRWHQRHNFYFRLSILGYDRIIFFSVHSLFLFRMHAKRYSNRSLHVANNNAKQPRQF